MKLKNLFFALMALVCVSTVPTMAQEKTEVASSTEQAPLVLSLDEALQIALSENPTVKIADRTIEAKKYAKRGTYAALWPEISASGAWQHNIQKQTFHIMGQTMKVGTMNNVTAGVTAAMPLVNAQLWKSLKLSAMDVELAVEQARSSRIDMIEQVSKAFFQVLLAKDSYNVYKRVYDNAVENHKIVEKRYAVGQVSEYDFIRSQVSVSNAEPNLFSAENAIMLALWQLKALLGVDLEMKVDCRGALADYEGGMTSQIQAGSLAENTTMKQLDIQERMLEQNIKLKRAANLPSLVASINYQFTAMDESFNLMHYRWNPSSAAVLSLNIPIFSGGKRRADIKQAKIDLSNIQLQRENTERQLKVAMIQSLNSMQTSVKQFNSADATVAQAKRGYEISVKRYEVGRGTLVEIDNSQLALTQAELSRNSSIYNFLTSKVALDKILGNLEF